MTAIGPVGYDFDELVEWLDWQRSVVLPSAGPGGAHSERSELALNPFLAAAERFGFKPPLDVQAALEAMTYEAPGENSIHQTQLRVSASMAAHGHDEGEIVDVLLSATKAAAGERGAFWNWSREEKAIRGMVASAKVKFGVGPQKAGNTPSASQKRQNSADNEPGPDNVIPIAEARTRQQARPKTKVGPNDPLITRLGELVLEKWQAERPILARINGGLWCYAAGWWKPFDEEGEGKKALRIVIRDVLRDLKINPKSGTVSDVYGTIIEHSCLNRDGSFETAEPVVVGRSNTLILSSGRVVPHSPDHLAMFAIDCEHDELALCPDWLLFLSSAFSPLEEGDRVAVISFLQEWFGIALAVPTKRELRKALLIHGQSRTGKTQILNVLTAMLGGNIASVRLSTLQKPFGASFLYNCSGWVANDAIGSNDDLADELFKQIITGEPCSVEPKNKQAVQHSFRIPVIMSSNTLPRIKDTSDGVYNRIAVLRMTNVIPEGSEGTEEVYEGIVRDELAGVFQWALEGRRRALARGRFVIPKVVTDEVQALKTANNPTREFASRFWVPDAGCCVDRRDIWCLWCAWLEDGEGDPSNERYGKQTVFRLFEGAAGCRTAQNTAGRTRYLGGRLTDQGVDMILDFVSRYPLEKRKHGSGLPSTGINQAMPDYVKRVAARGGEMKPAPDGKSGPKVRF
jgi:P4 family phage/plasmid primase-like protien